ncbi:putative retrotransposon hot spot protein (RHS) [Trypanosoma cruzi]|uniref:Putative retrotransposon hot spot protein (RHS) n=1 Tax=Trypanosoma cruzi TaxID=5693 RepID=A0A2V2W6E7_TRYCR|nr:putative retrotransposon hot spot protein (RHS) [Trypanosoma cruzi]RNC56847.1 retrotransposon hot spot (RHS) protein [Trypanosoma cruzi]
MKGHVIYDVTEKGTTPAIFFVLYEKWGMIVASPLNARKYDEWETQVNAERIIVNCPEGVDVKTMCAWMKRNGTTDEQEEHVKMIKGCMDKVGPIPRYIFDVSEFIAHSAVIQSALDGIKSRDGEKHFTHGGVRMWYSGDPPQKLVSVVRARGEVGAEGFLSAPISVCLGRRIPHYFGGRDE